MFWFQGFCTKQQFLLGSEYYKTGIWHVIVAESYGVFFLP